MVNSIRKKLDNKKYAVYLNGKQIDDVKDLSILNAVTRMFISTYPIDNVNHGDIYLDNVCLYKIDNEPDKDVAAWSVAVGQSGDLSVLFADDMDPALINKNNIALYKDGKKLAFTITEKSAFGFALNPKEELKDGEYELTLDNVFGSGGQKLAEDTIRLRNTAGTYQYITDKQDYLTLEVTGNTITVINKTGSVKSYVLLTGYYKDGVLHHMSSVKGISEASEIRKNYSVLAKDGYEIRAFIFDRELSDIYFN